MSNKHPYNTTPIDQLIDLDDIPSTIGGQSADFSRKMQQENYEREKISNGSLKSKIRSNSDFRQAMNGGSVSQPSQYYPAEETYQLGPKARYVEERADRINVAGRGDVEYFIPPFNCLDVSNHIMSCPICSKIYNDDKTPYIIGIALLIIVVIVLIKKLMEKPSA